MKGGGSYRARDNVCTKATVTARNEKLGTTVISRKAILNRLGKALNKLGNTQSTQSVHRAPPQYFERQLVAPLHLRPFFYLFLPCIITPCAMGALRASSAMPTPRCKTFAMANMAVCCPFCLARQLRSGGARAVRREKRPAGGRVGLLNISVALLLPFESSRILSSMGDNSPLLPRGGPSTLRFVQKTTECQKKMPLRQGDR